jgi:hypothetical protein
MTKELTQVVAEKVDLHQFHIEVLQEKDEVEHKVERVQQAIQNIYREVTEIPVVIEATIEEHI